MTLIFYAYIAISLEEKLRLLISFIKTLINVYRLFHSTFALFIPTNNVSKFLCSLSSLYVAINFHHFNFSVFFNCGLIILIMLSIFFACLFAVDIFSVKRLSQSVCGTFWRNYREGNVLSFLLQTWVQSLYCTWSPKHWHESSWAQSLK